MKNESGKNFSELKLPHLAIVKRIEDWKKPEPIKKEKEKKNKKEKDKKKEKNVFKKWNLPEQQHGYIKAKPIDLL